MGYTYNNAFGHRDLDSRAEWLDDSRLITTSQHFIQVQFIIGNNHNIDENTPEGEIIVKDFLSERANGLTVLVLPRYYIQSAEFDGVQIGARRGKITIIDPEGIWANCLNHIGRWKSNHPAHANMIINFGWVGLKESGGATHDVQDIPAVLLRTGFNMNEDGVVTIELEFVENTENLLNSVKFKSLDDMTILSSSINESIKEKKIHEVLQHLVEAESIKTQLEAHGIKLTFDETYEKDDQKYAEDTDDIKIRIGDTLGSKINELISRAIPENFNDDDPDRTYSYEMIRKEQEEVENPDDSEEAPFRYVIRYGWAAAATEKALESVSSSADARKYMARGGEEPEEGPRLLWKKQPSNRDEKLLISFDIDLKLLDYASSMMKSELDKKLGKFSDKDWDGIAQVVEDMKGDSEKADLFSLDMTDLSNYARKQNEGKNGEDPFEVLEHDYRTFLRRRSKVEEDREIEASAIEFNKIIRESSNNVSNQINTIIKNNVFKAKARIMGDPSFGTRYTMYKVYFTTDFELVGNFAKFFRREWLLTKVTHKIEEGGFFTDMELLALPIEGFSPD